MNALQRNPWTEAWARLGETLPTAKAVLCVSAHWYVPGVAVTASENPRTIHDFGGFPRELFEVAYPAPGSQRLASRVRELLAPLDVAMDARWGLDHGTWSVLVHVYPRATVPVVQLSIDETQPASFHYEISKQLAVLRDEGILVMGSGNLVHNLHTYAWGRHPVEPYDWAVRFETRVKEIIASGDFGPLIAYETLGADAILSAPTPEHYLPLLYVLGQRRDAEPISFPVEGFDGGSVSMLSVRIG